MHNDNDTGKNNGLFFMGGATMGVVSAYLLTKYAYRNVCNDLKAAIARQVNGLEEYKRQVTKREKMAKNDMGKLIKLLEKASKEIYYHKQENEILNARILSAVKNVSVKNGRDKSILPGNSE